MLPQLAAATRVWRDLFPLAEEVYTEGLRFIREKLCNSSEVVVPPSGGRMCLKRRMSSLKAVLV